MSVKTERDGWVLPNKAPEKAGNYLLWVRQKGSGSEHYMIGWWNGVRFNVRSTVLYWSQLKSPPKDTQP